MDKKCFFLFGVHNHQPVGNFESVVEEAYQRSYRPFLDVLEKHPKIRIVMHFSGCLLDVLLRSHPEYLHRLRVLGAQGRIEFMTGGYYEPILSSIPDCDKVGQIEKMSDAIERHLGQRPVGLWLAERVWEPHLPAALVRAGVRYCVLDDWHFRCAGLGQADTLGYYMTEEQGQTLALFPIQERLRYTIPFADPHESFDYLRHCLQQSDGNILACVMDDGEKFGVWPGTHRHCYEQGWLARFFGELEDRADEFPMIQFREALECEEPRGRIYLPTASYSEMMEWALSPAVARAFDHARRQLGEKGLLDTVRFFFRGGFWRNFLAKYPESNQIHKKMLFVSRRINAALALDPANPTLQMARDFLWQGQCNCSYWHGLFGGLYLVHLRHALHRNLNIANRLWGEAAHGGEPWLKVERLDYDADGHMDVLVETERWSLVCAPRFGGMLTEVNYKLRDVNLTDTLSRREEVYHSRVAGASAEVEHGKERSSKDSHGNYQTKEAGLHHLLCYDRYRRLFAIDHFLPPDVSLDQFERLKYEEQGDFVNEPYQSKVSETPDSVSLTLRRAGSLKSAEGPQGLSVKKVLTLGTGDNHFTLAYAVKNLSARPLAAILGVELNLNLLAGDAPDRFAFVEGQPQKDRRLLGREVCENVCHFGLVDEWMDLKVDLTVSRPATLWRCALETVSLSESGLERNYQGTCLLPHWPLQLDSGEQFEMTMTLACSTYSAHPFAEPDPSVSTVAEQSQP